MTGTDKAPALTCSCGWRHPNPVFARTRMADGHVVRCAACSKVLKEDVPLEGERAGAKADRAQAVNACARLEAERDALRTERDNARQALSDSRAECLRLSNSLSPTTLDANQATKLAAQVGGAVEAALKAAFAAQRADKALAARTIPSDAPRAKLDLEPGPKQATLAGQALVQPPIPVVSERALAKAEREVAAQKAPDRAPDPAKVDPTPTLVDTPKAPAPKAGKLARCPACKGFVMGAHTCKK